MTKTRKAGKMMRLVLAVYVVLSLPPVLYVSNKVIYKVVDQINSSSKNGDFILPNEFDSDDVGGGWWWGGGDDYRLIAHAGGCLFDDNGAMLAYTNAKEAIVQNYAKGHRVFEIDFSLTKDGHLAAVHDWPTGKKITNETWKDAPSLKEWKEAKIYGKYTTIDIDDVISLMDIYKDMYLVTDTKETNEYQVLKEFMEIRRAADRINPETLDRIIPQIYFPKMLKIIYAVHDFQNVIYTLYQSSQTDEEVLQFAANHQSIGTITMWPERASAEFVDALSKIDKKVYVHSINKFEEAYEVRKRGIFGIYTDYLF